MRSLAGSSIIAKMPHTFWRCGAAMFLLAGLLAAQPPLSPPANPAQSPASRPRPQSAVAQSYPADQVRAGEQLFVGQCGFCHGRDAAGGEGGPDLTRSELVVADNRGDKLTPFFKTGRPAEGMPAFTLSDADALAVVAFIHDQKTKFEAVGGGRRSVEPSDLATGNAEAGKKYFAGAGGCAACHSATGDLAGIGMRYQGLQLMQRMLYPSTVRPAPKRPKVTVTLAGGQTITADLAADDEFTIQTLDAAGARQTYEKRSVKYTIVNGLDAHFEWLGKLTDADMHNVYAYLETLK
ncbi:MAG: hypothetical protein RL328_2698 [Acidobacteriota bacterium]